MNAIWKFLETAEPLVAEPAGDEFSRGGGKPPRASQQGLPSRDSHPQPSTAENLLLLQGSNSGEDLALQELQGGTA